MTVPTTHKTPSAELAGTRAEGLNSPTIKKESSTMVSAAVPTRIALENGPTIDVDPIADHLEVTISSAGHITFGLALTRTEARRLASALLDAAAPTFGESPVAELEEHAAVARRFREPMTPAKAFAAMKAGRA